jgi:hypothetical protein
VKGSTPHEDWDLHAAHSHAVLHRREIESSNICGCFYCRATYQPSEIVEWIEDLNVVHNTTGETALCPKCGIDSVIGSASGYPINDAFLKAMEKFWFK